MYIRNLTVTNYLIHESSTIKLPPITVLVGQNGGGKSALFDAIVNFSMLSRGSIDEAFGPFPFSYNTIIRKQSNGIIGFKVELSMHKNSNDYYIYEIEYNQKETTTGKGYRFEIPFEKLTLMPSNEVLINESRVGKLRGIMQESSDAPVWSQIRKDDSGKYPKDLKKIASEISRVSRFRLDPINLSKPANLPEYAEGHTSVPRMGPDGKGLAAVLYHFEKNDPDRLANIVQKIKLIEPNFQGFTFGSFSSGRIIFSVLYSDVRQEISAQRLSSGFLTFIGAITLLYSPNIPSVLMIEEPENGLTPSAIQIFYETLRDISCSPSGKKTQFLISSHSPFVITTVWNDADRNFLYLVKAEDGKSVIRKFSEVQKIETGWSIKSDGTIGVAAAALIMRG